MKQRLLKGLFIALGLAWLLSASAESVESLRGAMPIDGNSASPKYLRYEHDHEPIARNYVQQPPLIPHAVDGYKINLKFNKCLTCHSWANYQTYNATKISQTHFNDREGHELANVAPRRYFCTQCHVPQVDAPPLVANDFKPVTAVQPH